MTSKIARAITLMLALLSAAACSNLQSGPLASSSADPHVTPVGFFDLHVCHWPNRPVFYKAVFSSIHFDRLRDIRVYTPDGTLLTQFNLEHYRTVTRPREPEKRVYLVDTPVPDGAADGWYTAVARTVDGRAFHFRDWLEIRTLPQAVDGMTPSQGSVLESIPTELSWSPVPGAKHYLVYIHDRWEVDRQIYKSPLLTEPRATLPPGILHAGGSYTWRINARDQEPGPVYGDFNHGSMTPFVWFTIQ